MLCRNVVEKCTNMSVGYFPCVNSQGQGIHELPPTPREKPEYILSFDRFLQLRYDHHVSEVVGGGRPSGGRGLYTGTFKKLGP